jgi:general secretion pathway protein J
MEMRMQTHQRGFTLIELLVAVSIMALMSVMGWRTLGGMQQATTQTRIHTDAVLTLDAALAQWGIDLDALIEIPRTTPIDWDGRALRITRSHNADASEGVLVVAWASGMRDGKIQWLRWQSQPVRTQPAWAQAWQAAATWAQSPSEQARQSEVAITPVEQLQIYYYRGGAWSNPLSSAGTPGTIGGAGGAGGAPPPAAPSASVVPDGVRLLLTLAPPHPLAGLITRDWARPVAKGSPP